MEPRVTTKYLLRLVGSARKVCQDQLGWHIGEEAIMEGYLIRVHGGDCTGYGDMMTMNSRLSPSDLFEGPIWLRPFSYYKR